MQEILCFFKKDCSQPGKGNLLNQAKITILWVSQYSSFIYTRILIMKQSWEGIAIGIAIGTAIGVATNNISLRIALWVALWAAIWSSRK